MSIRAAAPALVGLLALGACGGSSRAAWPIRAREPRWLSTGARGLVLADLPTGGSVLGARFWGPYVVTTDGAVVGVLDPRDGALLSARAWASQYDDHEVVVMAATARHLVVSELDQGRVIASRVWDVARDRVLFAERLPEGRTTQIAALDTDGTRLAFVDRLGWVDERFELRVVALEGGAVSRAALAEAPTILGLDRGRVLVGFDEAWEIRDAGALEVLTHGDGAPVIAPSGGLFATVRGERIELRSSSDGALLRAREAPAGVDSVRWSADGRALVVATGAGTSILGIEALDRRAHIEGDVDAVAARVAVAVDADHRVRLTRFPRGVARVVAEHATGAELSIDGTRLLLDVPGRAPSILDLATGRRTELSPASAPLYAVDDLAWSCDHTLLVTRGTSTEAVTPDALGSSREPSDAPACTPPRAWTLGPGDLLAHGPAGSLLRESASVVIRASGRPPVSWAAPGEVLRGALRDDGARAVFHTQGVLSIVDTDDGSTLRTLPWGTVIESIEWLTRSSIGIDRRVVLDVESGTTAAIPSWAGGTLAAPERGLVLHLGSDRVAVVDGAVTTQARYPASLVSELERSGARPIARVTEGERALVLGARGTSSIHVLELDGSTTWRAVHVPEGTLDPRGVADREVFYYARGAIRARALGSDADRLIAPSPEPLEHVVVSSDGAFVAGSQGARVHLFRVADGEHLALDGMIAVVPTASADDGRWSARPTDLDRLRVRLAGPLAGDRLRAARGDERYAPSLLRSFLAP